MNDDLLDEIREARRRGDLLGPLTERFGAAAVVEALGVTDIAHCLGVCACAEVADVGDEED